MGLEECILERSVAFLSGALWFKPPCSTRVLSGDCGPGPQQHAGVLE